MLTVSLGYGSVGKRYKSAIFVFIGNSVKYSTVETPHPPAHFTGLELFVDVMLRILDRSGKSIHLHRIILDIRQTLNASCFINRLFPWHAVDLLTLLSELKWP